MTAPTTRFAPAPTGRLHLGHLANAIYAWGLARKKKLLVMVSDGLPTECSASSLRNLALRLERGGMLTAQVAVRPISTQLFKHYVEILDDDIDDAARRFAKVITRLVRKTLGR